MTRMGTLCYEGNLGECTYTYGSERTGFGKEYRKDRTLRYEGDFVDGKGTDRKYTYFTDVILADSEFVDDNGIVRKYIYFTGGILAGAEDFADSRQVSCGKICDESGALVCEGDLASNR